MTEINDASTKSIQDLLGGMNAEVVIPTFQRSYSWSKDQASDLISDLSRFDNRNPDEQINSATYFLGSVVATREGAVYRILDGQQRLATVTIFLSVVRDLLKGVDDESAKELHRDLIQSRRRPTDEMRNRLQLNVYDVDFFDAFVQQYDRDPAAIATKPSHKNAKAVRGAIEAFLTSKLEELDSDQQKIALLTRYWTILAQCLRLVVVVASDEEDATEVFEVLNERGAGLLPSDLLRNFLLGAAQTEPNREKIVEYWDEVFSLSDKPAPINTFLRHFWIAGHGDVKSRGLYREIKATLQTEFGGRPAAAVKFSKGLAKSAGVYKSLLECSTDNEDLAACLTQIKSAEATVLYPLILASIEKHGEDDALKIAPVAFQYFVRWTMIGNRESTVLEKVVFGLAEDVTGGKSIDDAIAAIEQVTPDDAEFKRAFELATLTKAGQQRVILETIEKVMRDELGLDELELAGRRKLHIEHVYPQTPKDGHRLEDHQALVNRIGNLTLLGRALNTSLQNAVFDEKQPEYKKSEIHLNAYFEPIQGWDKSTIEVRQKELAEWALRIW